MQVASCFSHSAGIEKPSAPGVAFVPNSIFAIKGGNIEPSAREFNAACSRPTGSHAQVAASMAFEGEPVDFEWLKNLHNRRTPRAS
jgi:hypothetical protein